MEDAPAPDGPLRRSLWPVLDALDATLADHRPVLEAREAGTVVEIGNGVARVAGFTDIGDGELVHLPGGGSGMVADLERESVGIVLLSAGTDLTVGAEARRSGRRVDVPVGAGLLGRVVDPLGRPLDGGGQVPAEMRAPVERPAPPIIDRAPVDQPLQTGIKAVDAAIPVGRGQRELILGDRQTGKTTIAVDTILNQRDSGVLAVYCAIAQRSAGVARVVEDLRAAGALEATVVVVAAGDDPPGLQFVAPYAATAIAEWFMDRGRDVLVVYDDLTRHARAYRELSLLLRRPPGREAYPGDIFFVHSRLLERATHLRADKGGGSLTALPIVETQAQNLAAYIPTNLISITDGQIYLSPELFRKGHLPAVDIGRSVSRVGGKAQLPAFRAIAGDLRLSYAQFEELETFARFGTRLDVETRRSLERGARVRAVLRQREHDLLTVPEQLTVLLAATQGLLDDLPPGRAAAAEDALRRLARDGIGELGRRLGSGGPLGEADRSALLAAARSCIERLPTGPDG